MGLSDCGHRRSGCLAAGKLYGTHLFESDCISDYSIFYQWIADLCDNERVPGLTYGQNHDRRYHVIDTGEYLILLYECTGRRKYGTGRGVWKPDFFMCYGNCRRNGDCVVHLRSDKKMGKISDAELIEKTGRIMIKLFRKTWHD